MDDHGKIATGERLRLKLEPCCGSFAELLCHVGLAPRKVCSTGVETVVLGDPRLDYRGDSRGRFALIQ